MQTLSLASRIGMTAIYALVDPREPETVKYIGQSKTPANRLTAHATDTKETIKAAWLRELKDEGILPQLVVLKWVPDRHADKEERLFINLHFSFYLTNSDWQTNRKWHKAFKVRLISTSRQSVYDQEPVNKELLGLLTA